jgi:hypothetical protein
MRDLSIRFGLLELVRPPSVRPGLSREVFHVLRDVAAFFLAEISETGHRTPAQSSRDAFVQIVIRGHCAGGGGLNLEQSGAEVARPGKEPNCRRPVAIAVTVVASRTVLLVNGLAGTE